VAREAGLVSTLDLLGEGLTLFAGPDWEGIVPAVSAGSAPLTVERLDGIASRAVGLAPRGSLIARPDGQPVALTNEDYTPASASRRTIPA
jgi:hypothetical protein